jgi:hypothetical protein
MGFWNWSLLVMSWIISCAQLSQALASQVNGCFFIKVGELTLKMKNESFRHISYYAISNDIWDCKFSFECHRTGFYIKIIIWCQFSHFIGIAYE